MGPTAFAVFEPKEIMSDSKLIDSSLHPETSNGIFEKSTGVEAINTFFAPLEI